MTIRIALIILSFLNGGYMLVDGIHVMIKGKYIGPQKPGPWSGIMDLFEINVFKMGPLFIIYGLLWLSFLASYIMGYSLAYPYGMFLAIMTLWYIPIGSIISLVVFVLLYMTKQEVGF